MTTTRRIASITVSSYVPLEENAADTLGSILGALDLTKTRSVEEIKKIIGTNCIDEKKARMYSKYKRARKVRLSIMLEEIPPARGFKKRYKTKVPFAE